MTKLCLTKTFSSVKFRIYVYKFKFSVLNKTTKHKPPVKSKRISTTDIFLQINDLSCIY